MSVGVAALELDHVIHHGLDWMDLRAFEMPRSNRFIRQKLFLRNSETSALRFHNLELRNDSTLLL